MNFKFLLIILLVILIYTYVKINNTIVGSDENIKSNCIFWFRRDFRLYDNLALNNASKNHMVIPVFIFDDRQISANNEYYSNKSASFMINSLKELEMEINKKGGKLLVFHGDPKKILMSLSKKYKTKHDAPIFYNIDYTPFSIKRDSEINNTIETFPFDGTTMLSISKHYKKFTPFYNFYKNSVRDLYNEPNITFLKTPGFLKHSTKQSLQQIVNSLNIKQESLIFEGGRSEGLKFIKDMSDKNYKYRNILTTETSHISAHLKYGNISIREAYEVKDDEFKRQLFWREFYYDIAKHDPNCLKGSYYPKHDLYKWKNNLKYFDAWCKGETGYPIVDACMNQLNSTGFMHGRGRLIVADFLTKILNVDWRLGEKYFAQNLIDYDPIINNYNWQWIAGTAPFSQPRFRIFNPKLQTEKQDPEEKYIQKWCTYTGKKIVDYKIQKNKYLASININKK